LIALSKHLDHKVVLFEEEKKKKKTINRENTLEPDPRGLATQSSSLHPVSFTASKGRLLLPPLTIPHHERRQDDSMS